ncbi:MAG: hypothetical protein ABI559_11260 [Chloroflexota bacterium]
MGPVETAIRARFPRPERLFTPTDKKPYELYDLGLKSISLKLGTRANPVRIEWAVLEGIPDFLRDKGWVNAAGMYVEGGPPTLDHYLKPHVTENVGRWLAHILSEADIVRLRRGKPVRMMLVEP